MTASGQGNYAILVGISRYSEPLDFRPLDGPPNDVERMYDWLVEHEEVPPENIVVLATPKELFNASPSGSPTWSPTCEHFSQEMQKLTLNAKRQPIQRPGRLYLYFAGHGFSMAQDDRTRAAVYAADATRHWPRNFGGTVFADALRRGAFFREIVLIMDCCRDAEYSTDFETTGMNSAEHDSANNVCMFSLYASHKGGKAQERPLPDSDGKVVGVLTHGFLKALAEAPPDVLGRISVATLRAYMELWWPQWFASPRPDAPRFSMPEFGNILLRSRAPLVEQAFQLASVVQGQALQLRSEDVVLQGRVGDASIQWRTRMSSVDVPITQDAGHATFRLQLPPVPHTLRIVDAAANIDFQPGDASVITI